MSVQGRCRLAKIPPSCIFVARLLSVPYRMDSPTFVTRHRLVKFKRQLMTRVKWRLKISLLKRFGPQSRVCSLEGKGKRPLGEVLWYNIFVHRFSKTSGPLILEDPRTGFPSACDFRQKVSVQACVCVLNSWYCQAQT